jgi:hypothetical protein
VDYVGATAEWLCRIRNADGGWGIYPTDNTHVPITAEVLVSLAGIPQPSPVVVEAIAAAGAYLNRSLVDQAGSPESARSTVHLCWLLLGNFAYHADPDDQTVATVVDMLVNASMHGWSWRLPIHGARPHDRAIYPTYLALRTLQEASKRKALGSVDFGNAATWIVEQRCPDGLWGSGQRPLEERVLSTAYALLGLHHAGYLGESEAVHSSMRSFANAALSLGEEQAVVLEKSLAGHDLEIPWYHSVLPQVVLSFMLSQEAGDFFAEVVPRALSRQVRFAYLGQGAWANAKMDSQSPYIAAEALMAFNGAHLLVATGSMASGSLIDIGNYLEGLEVQKSDLNDQLNASRRTVEETRERYRYQWRYIGLSLSGYLWFVGIGCLLMTYIVLTTHHLARLWTLRIALTLLVLVWYVPMTSSEPRSSATQRLMVALALLGGASLLLFFLQAAISEVKVLKDFVA